MLDFFRRYQRYFFLVITVVIIISFSFFGTYSTLGSNTWREQVAFRAVNGHDVIRSDVDEMALFLATDNDDKTLYGGVWGLNFLNDGVIRKDFLETGLAQQLALAYEPDLQGDIKKRLEKEKKYKLYTHPGAPFLSVKNVWSYFSPQMNTHFEALQAADNGLHPSAFANRVQLYLDGRKISSPMLRYVLRYQEKQYEWLKPDDRLGQMDLSLFGYHTLEDWFGGNFTRLVSEFIINAAILAENQGYVVTKAEALTDLMRNAETSYQQNKNNPNMEVTSSGEYLTEQLRRLNMDSAKAVKIWSQVLLFRRYFDDVGSNALVDSLVSGNMHQFGSESVVLESYHLPASLQIANYNDLQQFEIYLYAVAKQNKLDPVELPSQFLPVVDVAKKYPELVQKRYVLEMAKVNQKALQSRITLRDLWNWEVEDLNWEALTKQFPLLGIKSAATRDGRLEELDALDVATRSSVDAFARQAIVKEHPEWIERALQEGTAEKVVLNLRMQGGIMPITGLKDKEARQSLMVLLDKAPVGEKPAEGSPLYNYTADGKNWYRIEVLSRAEKEEIVPFGEARIDETLSAVSDRILEKYYATIRDKNPSLFRKEGSEEWLSFEKAKDKVADQFFDKVIQALQKTQKELASSDQKSPPSKDSTSSLRFYSYLHGINEQAKKDPQSLAERIQSKSEEKEGDSIAAAPISSLADQWKLEKTEITVNRQGGGGGIDPAEAFALTEGSWSQVKTPQNGSLAFYQLKSRSNFSELVMKGVAYGRKLQVLLGDEVKRHLMQQMLEELKEKNAISLAYLKVPSEETNAQEAEIVGDT